MKRVKAAVLAAAMVSALLLLCACGGEGVSVSTTAAVGADYDAAFARYDPDTVVLTVNGSAVTWREYYYWLYYWTYSVEQNDGPITDWSAVTALAQDADGADMTYRALVKSYAEQLVTDYHIVSTKAAELGAALTAADEAEIDEAMSAEAEELGGEESFESYLARIYLTPELYRYLYYEQDRLYDACFAALFGADGSLLGAEETAVYAQEKNYVCLRLITLDAGTDADAIVADLEADPTAYDTLYAQYNTDADRPALVAVTAGDTLYTAASSLADYGAASVVENGAVTVLQRVPCDAGAVLAADNSRTLGYAAAAARFGSLFGSWYEEAVLVWYGQFADLDPAELFA